MKTKAVIDRFEGKTAVLTVGQDERKVEIPLSSLPRACKEGDWLQLELEGEKVLGIEMDPEETNRARKRIEEKMAALLRGDQLKK